VDGITQGVTELWGGKLRVSGSPKFSALPRGEAEHQTCKRFWDAGMCLRSSITMPSLVRLGF